MKTILLITTTLLATASATGHDGLKKAEKIEVACTEETLKEALKEYDVKNPTIVLAQAMHETGNFTSKLFKVNHNLFGMKLAERRKTTAIGEHWRHAKYSNWIECVKDYKLWQLDRKITTDVSPRTYFKKLSLYAEDPTYIVKLKKKLKEMNQ